MLGIITWGYDVFLLMMICFGGLSVEEPKCVFEKLELTIECIFSFIDKFNFFGLDSNKDGPLKGSPIFYKGFIASYFLLMSSLARL